MRGGPGLWLASRPAHSVLRERISALAPVVAEDPFCKEAAARSPSDLSVQPQVFFGGIPMCSVSQVLAELLR